jgi:hypothetical protein
MKAETTRRPLLPACAGRVNATALPSGVQHLGDGGLDAFAGIRDHQLDATQAAAGNAPSCLCRRGTLVCEYPLH